MMDKGTFSRLMDEFRSLSIKLAKLSNFMNDEEKFSQLGDTHRSLLVAQYGAMMSYNKILEIRIAIIQTEFNQAGIDVSDIINEKTQHPELEEALNKASKEIEKKKKKKSE